MLRLIKSGIITVIYLLNCRAESMSFSELPRPERERLINEWIISERDRKIMNRRFADKIKVETIAEEFDMSVRQIKRIVYKCENILLKHI